MFLASLLRRIAFSYYDYKAYNFNIENTVIYYKDDIAFANKVKGILETGKVQKGTKDVVSSEPDIVVVLGKDFN